MKKVLLVTGVVLLVVGVILFAVGFAVASSGPSNLASDSGAPGFLSTAQFYVGNNSSVLLSGPGLYLLNESGVAAASSYSTVISNALTPTSSMSVGIVTLHSFSIKTSGYFEVFYAQNITKVPTLPFNSHYSVSPLGGGNSALLLGVFVLAGLVLLIVGIVLTVLGVMKPKEVKPKAEEKPDEHKPESPTEQKDEKAVTEEKKDESSTSPPPSDEKAQPQEKTKTPSKKTTSKKSSGSTQSKQNSNKSNTNK